MNFNLNEAVSLLIEKLSSWYEAAVKAIPNILVALLVVIVFIIFAKLSSKLLADFFHE